MIALFEPPAGQCTPCDVARRACVRLLVAVSCACALAPTLARDAAPHPQARAGSTVTVMPGETLDRVIRRSLPGTPFRDEALRSAFVRLNPAAFPRGTPHLMVAGAVLQVPTVDDLLRTADPGRDAAGMQPAAPFSQVPERAPAGDEERKRWVRYP